MYEVITEYTVEAAHQVPGHPKCGRLHGHTWKIVVAIRARTLQTDHPQDEGEIVYPFVVDFGVVKTWLHNFVPDHVMLNEVFDFIPTSENIAAYLYRGLKAHMAIVRPSAVVSWVEVWEGSKNRARYWEDHEDHFKAAVSKQFEQSVPFDQIGNTSKEVKS